MARLIDAFWETGYSATSVDDLARAAGLNRPSLYAAFGDKQAMYLKVLAQVRAGMLGSVAAVLEGEPDIDRAVEKLLRGAVEVYRSGPNGPRGCLVVCTAATQSIADPLVRAALDEILTSIDALIAARYERARAEGQIDPSVDPLRRARLVSAAMHSLAIRARAGAPLSVLTDLAEDAAAALAARR